MNCILLSNLSDSNELSAVKKITDPTQVKHVKTILKSKVGDRLIIGELNGRLGRAIISKINEKDIELIDVVLDRPPPTKLDLTVVLALPRPKVMRRLIMDMTALGVSKIILINSYRTQKSYWQSPLLNRLDEFVIEGLQQAVDTIPPVIEQKKRFKPFVEDELRSVLIDSAQKAVVAHPYALQSWSSYLTDLKNKNNNIFSMPKILCIGAEGGWIDYEVDLLTRQGCDSVKLGDRILRTEAVVNVLVGNWLSNDLIY